MNYKLFSSSVLAGFLLVQSPLAFGDDQGICATSQYSSFTINVVNSTSGATKRPILVNMNLDRPPSHNGMTASSGAGSYDHSSQAFQVKPTNVADVFTNGANTLVQLQPGDSVAVYVEVSYCVSSSVQDVMGQFALRMNIDGVMAYFQTGGSNGGNDDDINRPQWPDIYYDVQGDGIILNNAPMFSSSQYTPAAGSYNVGTFGCTSSNLRGCAWFMPYNPSGGISQGDSNVNNLKYAFTLPQRDSDQPYASCAFVLGTINTSGSYSVGPLCYSLLENAGTTYANDGDGTPQAPAQYFTFTINVVGPPINTYRTGLRPFAPTSYDPGSGS